MISSSKGNSIKTIKLIYKVQIFILINALTYSCFAITDKLEEIVNLKLVRDATNIV
jgi:hypothetical protein